MSYPNVERFIKFRVSRLDVWLGNFLKRTGYQARQIENPQEDREIDNTQSLYPYPPRRIERLFVICQSTELSRTVVLFRFLIWTKIGAIVIAALFLISATGAAVAHPRHLRCFRWRPTPSPSDGSSRACRTTKRGVPTSRLWDWACGKNLGPLGYPPPPLHRFII